MKPTEIARSAIRNAFRSRLRTTLTVLAIFVGAFTLTLTNGIGTGINDYLAAQVASMGAEGTLLVTRASSDGPLGATASGPAVYDPDRAGRVQGTGFDGMTARDLEVIAGIAGIVRVDPLLTVAPESIRWGDGERYVVTINPSGVGSDLDLVAGRRLGDGDGRALVLPVTYVEPLGFTSPSAAVGERVTLAIADVAGGAHEFEAEVVGVQQATIFDLGMIVSQELLAELYAAQTTGMPAGFRDVYAGATADLAPGSTASDEARVKQELASAGYRGLTLADQLGIVTTVIRAIVGVLNAFAVIALLAAGFGIINTLLMAVQERTREIGLMKAMGMSRPGLFALFSTEAVVIGFLGSAIGSLVAIGVGTVISDVAAAGPLAGLAGLRILAFDPLAVASVIVLVMVLAFLAGTLPAARAARLDPIEALRYE